MMSVWDLITCWKNLASPKMRTDGWICISLPTLVMPPAIGAKAEIGNDGAWAYKTFKKETHDKNSTKTNKLNRKGR
jgi:hypothetical protein